MIYVKIIGKQTKSEKRKEVIFPRQVSQIARTSIDVGTSVVLPAPYRAAPELLPAYTKRVY